VTPRAQALARQLAEWPRKRVGLTELWGLLDRVDPASRGSADRRRLLAAAVAELVDAGIVRSSRTDDGGRPPLPHFVQRVVNREAMAPARPVVWHHELAWAAEFRPSPAQAALLDAVNRWLFRGGTTRTPVPLRERALEITGDEKAFDAGPILGGRLTLDVLRAYRVTLPLHVVRLGDGPALLVVENSDTFDSLRRALSRRPGAIGRIAWGAGAAFESSVLSLADAEDAPPEQIHYFGDLDAAGLRIPASASALALEAGLSPIRPATHLYTALLARGRPQSGRSHVSAERARELVAWLDAEHRAETTGLLTSGQRLAQEVVGLDVIAALIGRSTPEHWCID
jgi:hypothetical protein